MHDDFLKRLRENEPIWGVKDPPGYLNQGQILVFQHDEVATAWITVQRVVARIPRVGYIVRTKDNHDFIVSGRPPYEMNVYYIPD